MEKKLSNHPGVGAKSPRLARSLALFSEPNHSPQLIGGLLFAPETMRKKQLPKFFFFAKNKG